MNKLKIKFRNFTDWIIIIITGILTLIFFLLVIIPMVLETKIFKTKKINRWVNKLIEPTPKDYINCIDEEESRYHNSEIKVDKSPIYTREMYDNSRLPDFFFTERLIFKRGLSGFEAGDVFPIYAYTYEVLIDLLNKGVLTTEMPKVLKEGIKQMEAGYRGGVALRESLKEKKWK